MSARSKYFAPSFPRPPQDAIERAVAVGTERYDECPEKSPHGWWCGRPEGHDDDCVASNGEVIVDRWRARAKAAAAGERIAS